MIRTFYHSGTVARFDLRFMELKKRPRNGGPS